MNVNAPVVPRGVLFSRRGPGQTRNQKLETRSCRIFWFLVSGFWFLVSGFWFLVSGFWFLVSGFWFLVCPRSHTHERGTNNLSYKLIAYRSVIPAIKSIASRSVVS